MLRTFAIAVAALGMATSAAAGPVAITDHLECFKMRDTIGYNAVVDLDPQFNNPGVPLQAGCRVAVKSKEICFPVTKTVVSSEEETLPVTGQSLNNGFLCYTLKCPAVAVPDFEVGDQFGVRTVGRLKSSRLCVPADW